MNRLKGIPLRQACCDQVMNTKAHIFPENGGTFEAGLFEADKPATDVFLGLITATPLASSRLQLKSSSANGDNHHLQELLV